VTIDDPDVVAAEYADERGLLGRRAAYEHAEGPDARQVAFDALAEVAPRRVLEVGCGPGELAERIAKELGVEVIAVDTSPRMVELARGRGLDARVGDVQMLDLADGSFDCALAAWMLYHVADVPRALSELARVLRPGGRLVAVTNDVDHLRELRELLGEGLRGGAFGGGDGERLLRASFATVERRDARGVIRFPDRQAVEGYVGSSRGLVGWGDLPAVETPFVVTRAPVAFVAEKAL
jgi:SAM-dependent methyltransferase